MNRRFLALLMVLTVSLVGFRGFFRFAKTNTGGGGPTPPVTWLPDDFNHCALKNQWTKSDPVGDLVIGNVGAGSGDSSITLSINAGTVHDPWVPNTAPGIKEPVTGDFTAEVKFTSPLLATRTTGQGLLAEDGAGNFLRFDVFQGSDGTHAFIGYITPSATSVIFNQLYAAGTPAPLWLRVIRTGTSWDFKMSTDGITFARPGAFAPFTNSLNQVDVKVFTSNAAPNTPAFTTKVDYFNVAAGAPTNEDVGVPSDGTARDLTLAAVGSGTAAASPSQTHYYCGEFVQLTATPDAGNVFTGWSGDRSGIQNPISIQMTAAHSVTANFTTAVSAPAMSLTPIGASQSVTQGNNAAAGSVQVTNTGGGTLHWAVSSDQVWVQPSPTSGTITTTPTIVALTFSTSGLAVGTYNATLTFTSSDVPNQTVAITVVVNTPGTKQFPDGSTDTGFNAPLASLGGQTCNQFCNGNFPNYVGSDTPAAGAVVQCKTWNQGFKLTHDNITIRCSDVSAPGDQNGIIKVPSGAAAYNFLIEGNKIHNAHTSSTCATQAITIYQGSGTIQWNDIWDVSDMYVQPGTYSFPSPVIIQWNYNHDNVTSWTCAGSHDESIHCETGNCPRTLHNRLVHSTPATGNAGTATYRSESNPGKIKSDDIEYNYLSGGGYLATLDGAPPPESGVTFIGNVAAEGAWHFGGHVIANPGSVTWTGNKCDNGSNWLVNIGAWNPSTDPPPDVVCNNF